MRRNINHYLNDATRVDYSDYSVGRVVEGRTLSAILSEIGGFSSEHKPRLKAIYMQGNCMQYDYRFALLDFSILITL